MLASAMHPIPMSAHDNIAIAGPLVLDLSQG